MAVIDLLLVIANYVFDNRCCSPVHFGGQMDVLIEQEIELHQYETRQNKTDIERLIHPSFSEIGKSGNSYDFASIIKMMAIEKPSNTRVHSQKYECVQLEPSVQLLKYESALVNECGEISDYAKRCSIWAFTGICWQLMYHQGTPCSPFELHPIQTLFASAD